MSLYEHIYSVVKRIPPGQVSSYGRIARIVNCTARQVGYAMAATPSGQDIPWHRVINSRGEISARKDGKPDGRQKKRLVDEGVVFDARGRISFEQYGCPEVTLALPTEQAPDDWPDPTAWENGGADPGR